MTIDRAHHMCELLDRISRNTHDIDRFVQALNATHPQFEWFWSTDAGYDFALPEERESK